MGKNAKGGRHESHAETAFVDMILIGSECCLPGDPPVSFSTTLRAPGEIATEAGDTLHAPGEIATEAGDTLRAPGEIAPSPPSESERAPGHTQHIHVKDPKAQPRAKSVKTLRDHVHTMKAPKKVKKEVRPCFGLSVAVADLAARPLVVRVPVPLDQHSRLCVKRIPTPSCHHRTIHGASLHLIFGLATL